MNYNGIPKKKQKTIKILNKSNDLFQNLAQIGQMANKNWTAIKLLPGLHSSVRSLENQHKNTDKFSDLNTEFNFVQKSVFRYFRKPQDDKLYKNITNNNIFAGQRCVWVIFFGKQQIWKFAKSIVLVLQCNRV